METVLICSIQEKWISLKFRFKKNVGLGGCIYHTNGIKTASKVLCIAEISNVANSNSGRHYFLFNRHQYIHYNKGWLTVSKIHYT